MALFGGGFATGLITGLAESANEALKNDIERINSRVDRISEFKVKRAIEEQDKRRAELDEVEKALQEGYALFGGEGNKNAADFAAGLLKESGSLEAYKRRIQELAKAKNDTGVDLGSFMERAGVDSPAGTISDYANAYVGSQKTFASDYRMPEGMKPVGGLVSKVVGKPIDTMALAGAKAQEELTARGVGVTEFKSVALPTITFQAEKFKIYGMKAGERLTYINDELAKPSNTEQRTEQLNNMLQEALTAAKASGDMTTKLDATKQMISRENNPEKLQSLFDEASVLSYEIDMAEAKATGSKIGMIDAEIKRQQYLNNTDKVKELVEQKKKLSGEEKTQSQITTEMEEELLEKVNNGEVDTDSDEFRQAQQEINNRKENEKLIQGVGDVTVPELNSAKSYFNSVENDIISQLLGGADGKTFVKIANGINSKILEFDDLPEATQEIYLNGLAKQKEAREIAIKRLAPLFDSNPALEQHIKHITGELPIIAEAGSLSGDSGQVTTSVDTTDTSTKPPVSDQTSQAIPTDTKPEQTVPEKKEIRFDALREIVKEDFAGAKEILRDSKTPQDAYDTAIGLYPENKQFATAIEFVKSKDDTGIDGLEKRIAEMFLQGLNANQITQQLKQVEYAGDTSMDVASISSTVARVLSELNPEARERRILNKQRASEAKQQQLEDARKPRPSLQLPSGLMSKQ